MEEIVPKPAPPTSEINTTPIVEEEFPHLEPGRYTLRKSQIHVNGQFLHTQKTYDIEVKVLENDDELLTEIGTRDPVAAADYKTGDTVIVTRYKHKGENFIDMLREDSFFLINNKLEERHFVPVEDK